MHTDRRRVVSLVLAVCCLLPALRTAVAGDAIKYPAKGPLVSFSLPDGWTHSWGNNKDQSFVAQPPNDDKTMVSISLFNPKFTEAEVTESMEDLGKIVAESYDMKDPQVGKPMHDSLGGGIDSVGVVISGKINGQNNVLLFRWFKVGNRPMTMVQLSPDNIKYGDAYTLITSSFKPLR